MVKKRKGRIYKVNNICKYCGIKNDGVTSFKSLCTCYPCANNLYKYNLNRLEVLAIWESQDKKCKICKIPLEMFVGSSKTGGHVDHDHETKQIRGILCKRCNAGIGRDKVFLDAFIEGLIDYRNSAYGT